MGEVFRARHLDSNRIVALKLLSDRLTDREELDRFQREMKVAASLSHWNLVKILDGGSVDGVPYLAMEFLDGSSLEDVLASAGRLPWGQAVRICAEVAAGLAELHAHRIVHRDLKPSNVMILGDTAKLIDFGLAKKAGATQLTALGAMMGTPLYMAPEMVSLGEATPAVDMWALGCILFRMLTGRLPIECDQPARLLAAVLGAPIPDVRDLAPETPASLANIVTRLLTRDPANRLQPASAFIAALETLENTGQTRTVTAISKSLEISHNLSQTVSFKRWWIGAMAVILGAVLMTHVRQPHPRPAPARSLPLSVPHPCAFDSWRQVEPLLHLIRGHRLDAATCAVFRRTGSIDLGTEADLWIHWVRLGRWTVSPDRTPEPPASPGAHTGIWKEGAGLVPTSRNVVDEASLGVWQGVCRSFDLMTSADQFRSMLIATAEWPQEGRAWLLLARAFELKGRADMAQLFYTLALKHLEPGALNGWPRATWTAWASALTLVPGHSLEAEWPTELEDIEDREASIRGLVHGVGDRKRQEEMLNRFIRRPLYTVMAQEAMGQLLLAQGERTAAMAVWEKAWKMDPQRATLCDKLMNACLREGDVDAARRYLEPARIHVSLWSTYEYCKGPPGVTPTWARAGVGDDPDYSLGSMEVYRLLELKQIEAAARLSTKLMDVVRFNRRITDQFPAIDVVGAGSPNAEVERLVLENLLDSAVDEEVLHRRWERATGAMSRPDSAARMNHWFDLAMCHIPPVRVQSLRVLWLSRRGMLKESLALLAAAQDGLEDEEIYEIISRPIWLDLLGMLQDHEIARLARNFPVRYRLPAPVSDALRGCYRELRAKDPRQTARYIQELRQLQGDRPAWILSELWAAAASGARALAHTVPRLRCRIRYELAGEWLLEEVARFEQGAARLAH